MNDHRISNIDRCKTRLIADVEKKKERNLIIEYDECIRWLNNHNPIRMKLPFLREVVPEKYIETVKGKMMIDYEEGKHIKKNVINCNAFTKFNVEDIKRNDIISIIIN